MNRRDSVVELFPARGSRRQDILWIAAIALIYFGTARLSLLLIFEPEGMAAIWPPAGVFLSAVLLTRRDLRRYLVAVLCATDFLGELLSGTPPLVSAIYSLALTGDAVLGSWLIIRFVGPSITFGRVRDVAGWLGLSVLFSNGLTSLVAAAAAASLPGSPSVWTSWWLWAAPDGVGNLLVTPFILGWASWARTRSSASGRMRVFEGAALVIALTLLTPGLFAYLAGYHWFALLLPYVVFPFLMWAGLRFEGRGVATAMLIFAGIAVFFAAAGRVPAFSFAPGTLDDVIVVQVLLAIMAIPALFLAAVVTERRESDAARLAGERRHGVTLNSIGDAVIRTDAEGRVELINPVAGTLTGWTNEEAHGKPLQDVFRIFNEETRGLVEDPVARVVREGTVVGLANHALLVAKDGTERPIADSGAPVRNEQGRIAGVVLVFRDRTKEQAAQEALRASETRYRRLFEAGQDGILVLDAATGAIVDVNPFLVELLGMSRAAFLDKKVWELGFFKDIADNEARFVELQQKGYVRYEDLPLETSDGRQIAVEFVSNVYMVNDCPVMQCNVRNVTERKRAEKEVQRQLNELRRWQDVMLDREDRVQDLKREVNQLCRRAGDAARYPSQEAPR